MKNRFTIISTRWRRAVRSALVVGAAIVGMGALVAAPQSARAQGVFDMGMLTNTMAQGAVVKSERERARRLARHRTFFQSALTASRNRKTTQARFTPSEAVRKRSIAQFVSRVRAADPQGAAALEKELTTKDVFGALAKKLATYGLKTNSVTDAFTVYTVVAWLGVRGSNDDPNKAHVRGVQKQMGHVLANLPAIVSASDAKKQELAEAFFLQAVLIDSAVAGAKKRPETMPQVKTALATGTQATLGYDLRTFKLTDKGLTL